MTAKKLNVRLEACKRVEIKVFVEDVFLGTVRTSASEPPTFEGVSGGTDLEGMRVVTDLMEKLWFNQMVANAKSSQGG